VTDRLYSRHSADTDIKLIQKKVYAAKCQTLIHGSDVNNDWTPKDKDKDQTHKDKDQTVKDKDKDNDLKSEKYYHHWFTEMSF